MNTKSIYLFIFSVCLLTAISCAPKNKTAVDIAEEFGPSVVTINVADKKGGTFNGTGFVITPDGLIATSRHVVEDAVYMNVTFSTGIISDRAQLVAASSEVDLAIIKIPAKDLPAVVLGNSDYALAGARITVIGNPRRLQNTVTSGLISQVRLIKPGIIWHQISAPISPSSSGSPVFNNKGEVISVVFSTVKGEENQNLNFAVPSNYLILLMRDNGYKPYFSKKSGGFFKKRFEVLGKWFGRRR